MRSLSDAKAVTPAAVPRKSPSLYEDAHVHEIYDAIAPHFSSTRYKPWPAVTAFLVSLPTGSVGLDAGTGNGKYLVSPSEREGKCWTIGLDRSSRLLDVARYAGDRERECVLGDVLHSCWRDGSMDFCISIATIHHLSTPERRKKSVKDILRCLSPTHGRALIYVWSTKQDDMSKRALPTRGGSGKEVETGLDVFVPWVLSEATETRQHRTYDTGDARIKHNSEKSIFNRYYHLFDEGELRTLILGAAADLDIRELPPKSIFEQIDKQRWNLENHGMRCIEIVKDEWERSNSYIEFRLCEI